MHPLQVVFSGEREQYKPDSTGDDFLGIPFVFTVKIMSIFEELFS